MDTSTQRLQITSQANTEVTTARPPHKEHCKSWRSINLPRGKSALFSLLFTCVLSTDWHYPPQLTTPSLIKHAPIVFPHLLSRNPYIPCVGTFEFSFTYRSYYGTTFTWIHTLSREVLYNRRASSKHINQHNPTLRHKPTTLLPSLSSSSKLDLPLPRSGYKSGLGSSFGMRRKNK